MGFRQQTDGTLVPLDLYETGGVGRTSFSPPPPRLNSLIAEDSIIAVDDRFVIVVNAGTNDVTSFRINADFSLTMADIEPSGGTSPISLAYHNGVVFVANADEDGIFNGPPNQSGNITAMTLNTVTGELTRITGYSLSLNARPADLEITPDGRYLAVSAVNAGSALLPQPTAAEVTTFAIQPDGTAAKLPSGTGMSTPRNNPAGRNLPNAIGIETLAIDGRHYLVAAESRTASSTGAPAMGFASLQTGSVSTWEIHADGSLTPLIQDFLLGPSVTSGPTQAGFLSFDNSSWVSVASSAGSRISTIDLFRSDGPAIVWEKSGTAADPSAPSPLANADGFVDIAYDRNGSFLYQLVGLKARIDVYAYDWDAGYRQVQQVTTGLFLPDNLQGLVVVGPRPPGS